MDYVARHYLYTRSYTPACTNEQVKYIRTEYFIFQFKISINYNNCPTQSNT